METLVFPSALALQNNDGNGEGTLQRNHSANLCCHLQHHKISEAWHSMDGLSIVVSYWLA